MKLQTRQEILELLRSQPRPSSFERMTTTSFYDHIAATSKVTSAVAAKLAPAPTTSAATSKAKAPPVTGGSRTALKYQASAKYYAIEIKFALAKNPDPILRNVPSPVLTTEAAENWGTDVAVHA